MTPMTKANRKPAKHVVHHLHVALVDEPHAGRQAAHLRQRLHLIHHRADASAVELARDRHVALAVEPGDRTGSAHGKHRHRAEIDTASRSADPERGERFRAFRHPLRQADADRQLPFAEVEFGQVDGVIAGRGDAHRWAMVAGVTPSASARARSAPRRAPVPPAPPTTSPRQDRGLCASRSHRLGGALEGRRVIAGQHHVELDAVGVARRPPRAHPAGRKAPDGYPARSSAGNAAVSHRVSDQR